MLTLQVINENPEHVIERLAVKHFDAREPIMRIVELDKQRRAAQKQRDDNASQLNKMAAQIGALMKQGKRDEAEQAKAAVAQLKATNKEIDDIAEAEKELLLANPYDVTVMRGDSLVHITLSGSLQSRVNAEQPREGLILGVRMPFVVKDFVPGSVAQQAGIEPGDSVVSVNGVAMNSYGEISKALAENAGDTITIGLCRHSEGEMAYKEISFSLPSDGKMGVQLCTPLELFNVRHIDYNFFEAIPAGISYGWNTLVTYISSLKIIFTKNGAQSLGGFITMGSIFPETWQWYSFWNITAFLALILAFMNFIPIPGLDGGYILFTLWEIITRRKPSDKFLTYANNIGFIFLLLLLVLANGNDIWRLIRGMF